MKRYWNGKRTVAAFVAATFWLFSTLAAFGANDETSRSSTSPVEPFESTAKIDPQTTVFLYLADCADENLRRIYVEYNKAIRAAFVESAGEDAFRRFLKEEEEREAAKLTEVKEAAALEHDAAFRKIETESKTPEEKAERVECFYEDLGVRRPGTTPKEWAAARERSIELESNRYLLRLWPLRPQERARLRVEQETWRLIEGKIWQELSVDWENLNLDGARFDFRPEVVYDLDAPGRGFEKFGGYRWGIPATLEQLSRSKSWRDKTLRGADFYRVLTDASFAGWTLENCRFLADELGQGTAFDVASKAPGVGRETRRPGELWQGAATENAVVKNASAENANGSAVVGYVGCDFADATLNNVLFDRSATITFAQFAATRSFKEDAIDAEFRFPLDGWDFAGKNVDALRIETPVAAEVASGETASESAGEATDDAASFAAEKPTVDESERVVYLFLKNAQSESAQALRSAWAETVRAAKAENAVRLDAFFFYERERNADGAVDRAWTRVFDGTAETLKSAKIDVDWENLNLDGVCFSASPRRWNFISGCEEKTEPYGDVECPLFVDDLGTSEIEYALPTTLAKLRRTVNWREKRLSDATFSGVCLDESFAGWTLTKCAFGMPNEPELRKRWPDGCKRANFTDATLDRCFFDEDAVLTFEQFAATRSYREDKICVNFGFRLNGWDFAGKNIGDVNSGEYAPRFKDWARRAKLDGARFEPTSKVYPALPEAVWRNSRACKEKDLAGATFPATLGGGDFSGFDLTGATMIGVGAKLDGATIRGLKVLGATEFKEWNVRSFAPKSGMRDPNKSVAEARETARRDEYGKITKETLYATKSWQDKDLRDVEFNWFYDLNGVDFSGCDLRGATFLFTERGPNKLDAAPEFENVDFTDAKIDGCKFYVFSKQGEKEWPTFETIRSTETWKSGDLERLKTCVLPDAAQKIVDRRIFEASPEFAAKDFSGKEIKFRDMSDWDLSGLNLTGCEISTHSLWDANLTGAILDGATLRQASRFETQATTERLLRKPFLALEQLTETDNYRRKSFRGLKIDGSVRDNRFSCAELDWTNAELEYGGTFDKNAWKERDFTDAEIADSSIVKRLTKAQLVATKTFKEWRIDFDAFDTYVALDDKKFAAELRAEYERLNAEKSEGAEEPKNAEKAEGAEEPENAEKAADASSSAPGAAAPKSEATAETRTFYLYDAAPRKNETTGETDWESLSLDGATLSDNPFEIFDEDVGEENGVPATLAQLRRTKTWREKRAREVVFNASLVGESFAGWTFERCEFGGRWRTVNGCVVKDCDFADATFDDVYFGAPGITFEQFAASRSFKEDKIVAEFTFPLDGWDFAGKNVANIEVPTWDGAKLDGARLETPRTTNRWAWGLIAGGLNAGPRDKAPRWAKVVPESLWRETEAFKNKDLIGTFFWPSLNGGDFSGFDLTDAFLLDGPGENFKLDGATIRGIKFRERHNVVKTPFFGAIPASVIYRTKSWKDKDLRGVCFGVYFDLKGADFAGCDLRGAVFSTPVDGADFSGADLRGAKFVWRAFYDSFE